MNRAIAVRPEPQDTGMGNSITMFRIGVSMSDGHWDDEIGTRLFFTSREAWITAGVMSRATGLPILGVDVAAGGETIQ